MKLRIANAYTRSCRICNSAGQEKTGNWKKVEKYHFPDVRKMVIYHLADVSKMITIGSGAENRLKIKIIRLDEFVIRQLRI